MYKNRLTVVSDVTKINQKKSEFVNLDELTKSTVQKRGEEDKENVNSQVDQSTHVAKVRRSSRNIRPPHRYSPTSLCGCMLDYQKLSGLMLLAL